MAAMQFIVSTPNIRSILESQANIPLTEMIDLGLILQDSGHQLSIIVLGFLPYKLSALEVALRTLTPISNLYPVTNLYRMFPHEHGIIMSPWQLAKGLSVEDVARASTYVFGRPNLDIPLQQPEVETAPKKILTPMEQEIEDILNFKIPASSKTDALPPVNKSNIVVHNGEKINVSKLSTSELVKLAGEIEDYEAFRATEHVRTIYHSSAPKEKLYYPEPFIAGPSHIHNDLGFLHILQYQFWLWFFFIFLICFFFISFICTVRWCNTRIRPRRETRGVSRSKCGDLITATVPITWAISIIVSETTDATDYYDGFGTSEMIVGVRAYQWGWEYYYPKTVDLQYNVKPSYASFIGNSVKYSATASKTLHQNSFWRTYQNKSYDHVVTPAHLLTLPLDNNKVLNFLNFQDIGVNTLKDSEAFKKIRTFSKTYTTNLNYVPLNTVTKYALMNKLYLDNNVFTDSLSYGSATQHTMSAAKATSVNYSTFLDSNSKTRFLNANRGLNTELYGNQLTTYSRNSLLKATNFNPSKAAPALALALGANSHLANSQSFNNLVNYPGLVNVISDDSDKKKFLYPQTKLINTRLGTSYTFNNLEASKVSSTDTEFAPNVTNFATSTFFNENLNSKLYSLSSSNQGVVNGDQVVRRFSGLSPKSSNFNLAQDLNSLSADTRFKEKFTLSNSLGSYYGKQQTHWLDAARFDKTAGNRLYMDAPHSVITSNNPYTKGKDYDSSSSLSEEHVVKENVITRHFTKHWNEKNEVGIIAGPREDAPQSQTSSYWRMFWAHTNPDLRLTQNLTSVVNNNDFYLPMFTNYADYDFLNDQALELLEDLVWEASHPLEDYAAYLESSDSVLKGHSLTPTAKLVRPPFSEENFLRPFNNKVEREAAKKHLPNYKSNLTMLATDDLILSKLSDHDTLKLISDYLTGKEDLADMSDADYDHLMAVHTLKRSTGPTHIATPGVLNLFRSNFESHDVSSQPSQNVSEVTGSTDFKEYNVPTERFSNPVSLRATAKSLGKSYEAYQKVFKLRFDESRSLVNTEGFNQLDFDQQIISSKVPFNKLLGKNAESFFTSNFSNRSALPYFNYETFSKNALNFSFYDFPFTLSFTNDMTRYLWFDWYVQWGKIEIQPSSSVRYTALGVPFNRRGYDFDGNDGDQFRATESYFTRISRTRRNYLPTWTYTPYLLNRHQVWTLNEPLFRVLDAVTEERLNSRQILSFARWPDEKVRYSVNTQVNFTPSFSGDTTFNKTAWRPFTSAHAYYYVNAQLADMLTKREYLYRQYLEANNKIIHLPYNLTSSPKNPLVSELKNAFLFIDPLNFTTEYSRDFYYSSLSFFKFIVFKEWLTWLNTTVSNLPINSNVLNNYMFFYFLGTEGDRTLGNNQELYKNQFRPLKKGINNMIRLQSTGAVAMPTEIRLRVLASSRDVIHSWSIPSAGIKIDCIPGYTSHRIMIFLNSGIYWGQCMEICGRFHHWMPIVVYFMKRDLFFLWCTHFAFRSHAANTWDITDRQYSNYIRFASYDKNTWLTELSKTL